MVKNVRELMLTHQIYAQEFLFVVKRRGENDLEKGRFSLKFCGRVVVHNVNRLFIRRNERQPVSPVEILVKNC